jgi:CheY-like chemotaxis protein
MNSLLSGRRMLVVEDEMLIRMTIEDMLADLGCQSVTATGASDKAIDLIDEQVFDAALLDMNLNGGSSRTVADALAAHGVPFVFATGNRGDLWDGFRDRAVLRKPFKHVELVEILTHLLPR